MPLNDLLFNYVLVFLLLGVGIFFTFYFRFIQLRALAHSVRMLWQGGNTGGVTPFQAFAIGLASRVGTGNIVGVAVALTVGGPGAIFWMWVTALLGMSSAFVEATLAQIFKVPHGDRSFRGGPAYYIRTGLGSRFFSTVFALIFAMTFGFAFNAVQAHSMADAFHQAFGLTPYTTGIILVLLTAPVLFGGIYRVSQVSQVVVPLMAVGYLALAGYVVAQNLPALPAIFSLIFKSAFGMTQAAGGFAGYAISQVMLIGIKRGLFSNEAGMGSAPNSAAMATTSHPVTQGLLQMLGVFVDTLIICSATALMILASGQYEMGMQVEGAALTQRAIASAVGGWGNIFMAVAIFFFAWTSIIGNYAYAEGNVKFISRQKLVLPLFRIAVLVAVVAGSLSSLPRVWQLADISMAGMTIINLIAIVRLRKYVRAAWHDYKSQRANGLNEPIFDLAVVPAFVCNLAKVVWAKESKANP